jgi:hypothetical protein
VKQLWSSPTLRSMVVYAASGFGFAGANLILARLLPTDEYALFTLVIALVNLGYSLAPAGVDGVVNRQHLEAGPRLLTQVALASTAVGLGMGLIGLLAYEMTPAMAAMLFVSSAAGGVMMVAAAIFQSEHRFGASLTLIQSPNMVLLLAAVAGVALHDPRAWPPILVATLGFIVAACWSWRVLLAERHDKPHRESRIKWAEAFALAGLAASGLLLVQLERLILPHVLPISDLALYGVLGAIAGSLFRVLQMGVGFSLLPRLRAAPTVIERRRLIFHEAQLVGGIALLGSAAIFVLTPLVERWVLYGKYHLPATLVLAAIFSGVAKILNAFTKGVATALVDPRELSLVNLAGWVSVALSVVAGYFGARWGLAGVIYGVALGWFLRAIVSLAVVVRHLRIPSGVPATAP